MNLFKLSIIAVAVAGLSACSLEGDDGNDGAPGAPGADGANGQNGLTSLTVQTELAVGDANCPNSGVRIDSGLDADADGTLADSEITSTSFVCVPGVNSVSNSELLTSLNNEWFVAAQTEVENNKAVWMNATSGEGAASSNAAFTATVNSREELDAMVANLRGKAKNVILFVGERVRKSKTN